jgi:VanZ family protein
MLPLRYAPWWRTASGALLVLVLLGAIMPAVWFWPDRGQIVLWFGGIDKWAHAIVFAFLALWFAGQYRPRSYWRIALGLVMFGILIELCQRMVGYRSAEWLDVAADAAGIIAGLMIAATGLGGWCQRLETRYLD